MLDFFWVVVSGRLRMFSTRWFCHMHTAVQAMNAARQMMSRVRSSVRCSMRLSRSSCETDRSVLAIRGAAVTR